VRDASELWALTTDSMPGADETLSTDQNGTIAAIRPALHAALGRTMLDDDLLNEPDLREFTKKPL
jgi:hypothetical protein